MKRLFYRIFLNNLGLKLIALFSAVVLWLHVTTEKIYTIEKPIKLFYIGAPKNLVILNPLPEQVTAHIRGKGKSLFLLQFSHFHIQVRLTKLRPGIRTIRIPKEIPLPQERDLNLVDLEPDSIVISVDRIRTRRVKIKVITSGNPKEGFALLKTSVLDRGARLRGPSQLIGDYPTVETEEIPIDGRDSTFITHVKLVPPIPKTTLSPESVKVKVYIEAASVLTFNELSLMVSGISPKKVKLEPEKVNVTLSGPQSLMKSLSKSQVRARIYIEKPKPGTYTISPSILVPSWAQVLEIKPPKIKITIMP